MKENVYAGKGMGRRSNYQYGILLTPGVTGKLAQRISDRRAGAAPWKRQFHRFHQIYRRHDQGPLRAHAV